MSPVQQRQPAEPVAASSSSSSVPPWRRWGWGGGTPRSARPPGSLGFQTSPWSGRLPRCWAEPVVLRERIWMMVMYNIPLVFAHKLHQVPHVNVANRTKFRNYNAHFTWPTLCVRISRIRKTKRKATSLSNLCVPTLPFFFLEASSASSSPSSISLSASSLFTLGSFCLSKKHVWSCKQEIGSKIQSVNHSKAESDGPLLCDVEKLQICRRSFCFNGRNINRNINRWSEGETEPSDCDLTEETPYLDHLP